LAVGALALAALLAITGCGGGGSSSSAKTSAEAEPASTSNRYGNAESSKPAAESTGQVAVVKVMDTPDLGKVIVDSKGMTLYDFHKDRGTTSACYGACAEAWPPLVTSGDPRASGGADAAMLGTTERDDGTTQVTYAGHPLYTFVEDRKPGEANGNDVDAFGAEWYALQPNGEEPED
jgi:predicted lipoprotein with Yx(FWY)xxD motif